MLKHSETKSSMIQSTTADLIQSHVLCKRCTTPCNSERGKEKGLYNNQIFCASTMMEDIDEMTEEESSQMMQQQCLPNLDRGDRMKKIDFQKHMVKDVIAHQRRLSQKPERMRQMK